MVIFNFRDCFTRYMLTIGRSISYQFIVNLPWTNTALPIALPTLYLWVVDTFALRRGTWSITSGTKYGVVLWDGLDIE